MHTTNYFNTLIEIAEDCPVTSGEIPPVKGDKISIANMQYDMLINHPYEFTSDDVIYSIFAKRNDISDTEWEEQRNVFFSKGQPCLRSSPLTKRYGWGVHSNEEGKIAIYAVDSEAYKKLTEDSAVLKTKAMRSSRKK